MGDALRGRTLDDIRALGGNDLEDERRFAAAARISEINLALYRTVMQPIVKATVTPPMAEAKRRVHPLRLSYEMFGPRNPFLAWVAGAAEQAREHRRIVASGYPFLALQEQMSQQIVDGLEALRKASEKIAEDTFRTVYGSLALQTALGIDPRSKAPPRKAAKSRLTDALVETRIAELRSKIASGGVREALVRALLYVATGRGGADERGFEAIRRIRDAHPDARQLTLAALKALIREQYFMLLINEEAALAAIPRLLPEAIEDRRAAFSTLREVLEGRGSLTEADAERLERLAQLFGLGNEPVALVLRDAEPARQAS